MNAGRKLSLSDHHGPCKPQHVLGARADAMACPGAALTRRQLFPPSRGMQQPWRVPGPRMDGLALHAGPFSVNTTTVGISWRSPCSAPAPCSMGVGLPVGRKPPCDRRCWQAWKLRRVPPAWQLSQTGPGPFDIMASDQHLTRASDVAPVDPACPILR